MIRIHDLTVPPLPEEERRKILEKKIRRFTGGYLPAYRIVRRSVDARKKEEIRYIYSVDLEDVDAKTEKQLLFRKKGFTAERVDPLVYRLPESGEEALNAPPLIIGAGPAGLFAAWMLAKAGYRPLVIEQGAPVEERERDVQAFWKGSALKPWSNVQFGEGGAGTFSDGKLVTGIKDPDGRIQEVLRIFTDCGADPSIRYDAKPHIGTDVLKTVVKKMREQIISMGGRFRFHTQLFDFRAENGKLCAVRLRDTQSGSEELIPASAMILAPGHSARETFYALHAQGLQMEAKPFAAGVRIEHPQSLINTIQYGSAAPDNLPPADYKLTAKTTDGRSVYSFCMCPGGQVVNASSEEGRLCVNGMSRRARDGRNANAALVVQVEPKDFEDKDLFAGLRFQRRIEETMYRLAGGKIPVQRWEEFSWSKEALKEAEKESAAPALPPALQDLPEENEAETVVPDTCGAWVKADVASALPGFMYSALCEAMPQFDRRMPGYACPEALIEGFEGRTSSPIRIPRGGDGQSNIRGIYPAGEGAGYAGGITSAAVDGIKAAEQIIRRFDRLEKNT